MEKKQVLEALQKVIDPELGISIVDLGMIHSLSIEGTSVAITLALTTPECPLVHDIEADLRAALTAIGAEQVNLTTTTMSPEEVRAAMAQQKEAEPAANSPLPVIRHIIAIASGKGGVGKSTIAVGLAVALSRKGKKVGFLDADIYGPSSPVMFGISQRPDVSGDGRMLPLQKYGVEVMSIGFLLESTDTAVIWRGPMIASAIEQMYREVAWGELDYLIVDLPPGTGDAALTVAKSLPLEGAIIVTTPQRVATSDARKAVSLFEQLQIPVFGVVENMSYFICPHCGQDVSIFGEGGGEAMAKDHHVPFLGKLPLEIAVREGGDKGVPVGIAEPVSPSARAMDDIAAILLKTAGAASQSSAKTGN